MATLVYAPGIEVRIATRKNGIVDVSDDIVGGNLSQAENEPANVNLRLLNNRRKYDGVFTPNDRITIKLKRINWVQSFSGYLNQVPFFSIYPRTIVLTATCTLKIPKFHLWDEGAPESYALLHQNVPDGVDGGMSARAKMVLTKVVGWDPKKIHIAQLPQAWFEKVANLYTQVSNRLDVMMNSVGAASDVADTNPIQGGTVSITGIGPGTGVLPATSGGASAFGGPGGGAYGKMALTGEPGASPTDQWYCAMRWPYTEIGANDPTPNELTQINAAINWWRNRRILVVNPQNNKAVCLRAADWGPNVNTGRVIDMSPYALKTVLRGWTSTPGDPFTVQIRFAPPGMPLGPVVATKSVTTTDPTLSGIGRKNDNLDGASQTQQTTAILPVPKSLMHPSNSTPHGITHSHPGGTPNHHDCFLHSGNTFGCDNVHDSLGEAIDIGVPMGTPISAIFAGAVTFIGWVNPKNPNRGHLVVVQSADASRIAVYGHVTPDAALKVGKTVAAGQQVGVSNYVDAPHLHLELWRDGKPIFIPGMTTSNFNAGRLLNAYLDDINAGGAGTGDEATPIDSGGSGAATDLLNSIDWVGGGPSPDSEILWGPRALMNDDPVLNTISMLMQASMRSFMAAPNGDFIGWFPDYFGTYGTAGRMNVEAIEMAGDGFTIEWSDDQLITHQFVAGAPTGFNDTSDPRSSAITVAWEAFTMGIVSVEFPEVMQALFNIKVTDPRAADLLEAKSILRRFGARKDFQTMGQISSHEAEFFFALYLFQQHWAQQFSSAVELTFMPEVFPGMLLVFPSYGLQCYVQGVTHVFDFNSGFRTTARVIAPAATNGSGFFGLPLVGG